jgi:hypothetical protein
LNQQSIQQMLTPEARNLLRIPKQADLPARLEDLYDRWFAGQTYETRFGTGWTFNRRDLKNRDGFDLCLWHRAAQFDFGMDDKIRVYVQCDKWVPIASSFVSILEEDALLVASNARGDRRRGFGRFPTYEKFLTQHGDYLSAFEEVGRDEDFSRIFRGPESVVIASRFYSDDYAICGIEYF